jgi:hypothetical protein
MSDYAPSLGLETTIFERLSVAYRGYANALFRQERPVTENHMQNRQITTANCYMVAAMYKSVYDQQAALLMFSEAARAYRAAGDSRWKLMTVCSQDLDRIPAEREVFLSVSNPIELYRELLLQYYLYGRREERNLGSLLERISSSPILMTAGIGHAAVPLGIYLSIIQTSLSYSRNRVRHFQPDEAFAALDELFRRNTELLQALRAYRFHWENQVNMFPFELEFLAFLIGLQVQEQGTHLLTDFKETRYNQSLAFLIDLAGDMRTELPQ